MLNSANIEHVFVLMLENRSFDHLLGFSGISGTDAVSGERRTIPIPAGSNTYNGVTYAPSTPAFNPMPLDPGHEFVDVVEQLGGADATYRAGGPYPAITNATSWRCWIDSQPLAPRRPRTTACKGRTAVTHSIRGRGGRIRSNV